MGGRQGLEVLVQSFDILGLFVGFLHHLDEVGILLEEGYFPVADRRDFVDEENNEGEKEDEQGQEG